MKLLYISTVLLCASALAACSTGAKSETDNVTIDSIADASAETATDSASSDSATVAPSAAADAVIVFDNESKAVAEGKPLVIDFSATWCGPCQQFKPTFHQVAEKYADKATFATADVDICTELAQKYQIASIPYVLIINTDGSTAHQEGKMSESEFTAFLDKNLK